MKALYQQEIDSRRVKCILCPHNCILSNGQVGICRARKCVNGVLQSLNYGCVNASAIDPVEKKPLYHFIPGSYLYSVGTFGCNFDCEFCQNHLLVNTIICNEITTPEKVIDDCIQSGAEGIAFTYNEPIIWYEFVIETAKIAKKRGLSTVLVTNGFINEEPLLDLLEYIDAINIDLKAFNGEFYKKICKGHLDPVIRTIELCCQRVHTEITCLIINTLNSDTKEFEALCEFLKSINPSVPLHISRYYPANRLNIRATDEDVLLNLKNIARKHLRYVYIGNLWHINIDTYCPFCGKMIIQRTFTPIMNLVENDCCPYCGKTIT